MKNHSFINTKTIIIHCGTNDLEKISSDKELVELYEDLIEKIRNKYPGCRIIISGLLPRNDKLNKRVNTMNNKLKELIANKENTTYVDHNNIGSHDLRDKKHLHRASVKLFARNIKGAFFNTSPKTKGRKLQPRPEIQQNIPKEPIYPTIQHANTPKSPFQPTIWYPTSKPTKPLTTAHSSLFNTHHSSGLQPPTQDKQESNIQKKIRK
jgi:hypothetical protein